MAFPRERSEPFRMLIGGELCPAVSGQTLASINPATEEQIASFPAASADDVDRAVAAALAASRDWRSKEWPERAGILRQVASRISEHLEEFAQLDTMDAGNPIKAMRVDAGRAVGQMNYFAGLAGELKGSTYARSAGSSSVTVREPYSVVGRIIPYNHPFMFAVGRIAAPLAAGCTVVLKPAEQTSLSALALGEILVDALPPGVVNIVAGTGDVAGAALVQHPRVPRIAFTGSAATGKRVLLDAASGVKHVSLELGGKNPLIAFPDVDPAVVANAAVDAMNFTTVQGQSCGATSNVLVHHSIYEDFCDAVVDRVGGLKIGDPSLEDVDMGPLAFEAHYERIRAAVHRAVEQGARVLTGGGRPPSLEKGYFMEPTVLADVGPDMQIAREEVFGPVMTVSAWTDYSAAIARANDTAYGLTANIWTNDLSLAARATEDIEAGYVWVNGSAQRPLGVPFGGYGESGLGLETSIDELESFTQLKSIISRPYSTT